MIVKTDNCIKSNYYKILSFKYVIIVYLPKDERLRRRTALSS